MAIKLSLISHITVEALIQHHTLYPFYAASLPQERSQQVLAHGQKAVKGLLAVGKTFSMLVSRVAKAIGQLTLIEQHLDQIPLTQAYLNSVTESIEAYQIRRVQWAAEWLDLRGEEVLRWKVVRMAGLTPGYSEKVECAIASFGGAAAR